MQLPTTTNSFANLDFLNIFNLNAFVLPPIVLWVLFGFAFIVASVMSIMLWFHWAKYGLHTFFAELLFFSGTAFLIYMAYIIVSAYGTN